ncbi:hypothetical protein BaRGS_00027467 [Batillaria attramentaria]|uniref:Uncharacterized protein n=1 Tax=Batillaria attramentaria TaxID=370345 RepID=A0ABD0K1F9_9CAEN
MKPVHWEKRMERPCNQTIDIVIEGLSIDWVNSGTGLPVSSGVFTPVQVTFSPKQRTQSNITGVLRNDRSRLVSDRQRRIGAQRNGTEKIHARNKMLLLKLHLLVVCTALVIALGFVGLMLSWLWAALVNVDPVQMTVGQLKALLELRGISYVSAVEKVDLTRLVQNSGTVTRTELETLQCLESTPVPPDTVFMSGLHFSQLVEENLGGGAWIVRVVGRHDDTDNPIHTAQLLESSWPSLTGEMAKLGLHTGVLDCNLQPEWCRARGWTTSRLIAAVPRINRGQAFIQHYKGKLQPQLVARWVLKILQQDIQTIFNAQKFKDGWMTSEPGLRVVLVTDRENVPRFFTSLRASFGLTVLLGVMKNTTEFHNLDLGINLSGSSVLLFITPEAVYQYGDGYGECLTYSCMETFLKFWYPMPSDLLSASIILAITLSLLDVFVSDDYTLWSVAWTLFKYNGAVLALWVALTNDHYLYPLSVTMDAVRFVTTSCLAGVLRRCCMYYANHPYILAASLLFAFLFLASVSQRKATKAGDASSTNYEHDGTRRWNAEEYANHGEHNSAS